MAQSWEEEWQALVRWRDQALVRSRQIQAEITATLRRREPPPLQLLRAADAAEGDLNQVKARLKDFLHNLGARPAAAPALTRMGNPSLESET